MNVDSPNPSNNTITPFDKKIIKKKRKKYIPEPITSYGLILFTIVKNKPLFLLYQRRDNFEYMDFLRGMWTTESDLYLLFSNMSKEERQRLRDYTFSELWLDLWVDPVNCRIFKDGYSRAKRKYDSIKPHLIKILNSTISNVVEPPWGFPKGKKNNFREEPKVCAMREFTEETRIPSERINILNDNPFIENFKGSNGKTYETHYYLARIDEPVTTELMNTPKCIRKYTISEEAKDIKWFDFKDTLELLSDRRREILEEVYEVIQKEYI